MSRKRALTEEEALKDLLDFIDGEFVDDGDDLDELNGDDDASEDVESGDEDVLNDDAADRIDGGDEIVEEGDDGPLTKCKILTKKRLVHDIDSALNEGNYDPMELPDGETTEWETLTGHIGPKKNPNTPIIQWTDEPPNAAGRKAKYDIVYGKPGVTPAGKHAKHPRQALELFLSPVIVNLIVMETNKKIAKTLSNLPTGSVENDRYSHYKETNYEEIYALFGLMYFRGLLGLNNHRVI